MSLAWTDRPEDSSVNHKAQSHHPYSVHIQCAELDLHQFVKPPHLFENKTTTTKTYALLIAPYGALFFYSLMKFLGLLVLFIFAALLTNQIF